MLWIWLWWSFCGSGCGGVFVVVVDLVVFIKMQMHSLVSRNQQSLSCPHTGHACPTRAPSGVMLSGGGLGWVRWGGRGEGGGGARARIGPVGHQR